MRHTYRITTVGLTPSGFESTEHVQYAFLPSSLFGKMNRAAKVFIGAYESCYWSVDKTPILEKLKNRSFDLIVANDIDTLPFAVRLARAGTKTIFDAHEYSPLQFTESLRWRIVTQPLVEYICREYIPRVTTGTTVCQSIAEMYERQFGKGFDVITNAADYEDLTPSRSKTDKIRLIYHGNANSSRQTHKQIEMMKFLDDRFELNLMLVGQSRYIESLKKMAEPLTTVKFLQPVPTKEIARFTNQFDVGVFLLPPVSFNKKYALPNKFFEFIQARLAIVIAPSPEMAKIVRQFDLGLV
ncbi:MAG: hypothetical protein HY646_16765, partial [Acidobacteria bacterium]|nr:hypothetical protein [Acidobacteriota bacterium]